MAEGPTTVSTRRASDADTPDQVSDFTLDQFYEAMRHTRRMRVPCWVELRVHPVLLDESIPLDYEGEEAPATVLPTDESGDILVRLVVTGIRQTFVVLEPGIDVHQNRYPDYEVEGWLYAPPGRLDETIWVRCSLRMDDLDVDEITVYRLEPGEQLGTAASWGML